MKEGIKRKLRKLIEDTVLNPWFWILTVVLMAFYWAGVNGVAGLLLSWK